MLIVFVVIFFIVLLGILLILLFFRRSHLHSPLTIERCVQNPILSPRAAYPWEAVATFNPAAYHDASGRTHLLYRAVGSDGVSRIGYAFSDTGSEFERTGFPVFTLENPRRKAPEYRRPDPVQYPSGGSWGGTEDPRMVSIEGRVYLIFNAFDGWDFIRIAVSSLSEEDFLKGRWNWTPPVFISPEGEIHKNWVLFPEKINGKFAILHSISPNIEIDYRDSIENIEAAKEFISSPVGPRTAENPHTWDTWVRGVGTPPLRTSAGWLVLYHARERHDPHRYKIGAYLLDLNDPTVIIARSPAPLLSPDEWYENDEKPGIVYTCGAVIRNKVLYVYYGGGDKHVCVATAPIAALLRWLVPVATDSFIATKHMKKNRNKVH
jgi:predicted GH43/DUF377 family glycosyl hydrolase